MASSYTNPGPSSPTVGQAKLRLFGVPALLLDGVESRAISKRGLLLIARLAFSDGRPVDRRYLAGLLWPDSTEAASLFNLRQTLAAIRKTLGPARGAIASVGSDSLAFQSVPELDVDVLSFDRLCAAGDPDALRAAVHLYRDRLLSGFDEPFVVAAREEREHVFLRSAKSLARHYIAQGNHTAAVEVLRRVLEVDPYCEDACRVLMESLAATGAKTLALEKCRQFKLRLRRDLRTDIQRETKAVYKEILNSDKPTAKKTTCDLPIPLSTLIGREDEIGHVVSLLNRCRIVTLLGTGGVGKTRIALEAARLALPKFLDGCFFISLAPLRDERGVLEAMATKLDIAAGSDESLREGIRRRLAGRELLLVLDNCEHVLDLVGSLVEDILSKADGVFILATSRQSLGVKGEFTWEVPPLGLPVPDASDVASIMQCDAVRLFVERASLSSRMSAPNALAICSICRRVDGLPLAIELAAARTKMFSLSEIDAQLHSGLALLTGGSKANPRHETLMASMQWSWQLLSEEERELLKYLSVFRGGCSVEAAQSIPGIGEPLCVLASLVDKSLVKRSLQDDESRYYLLETIREFAQRKIEETSAGAYWRTVHRDYFLAWVQEGWPLLHTDKEMSWFLKYEKDLENLRCAIDWCYQNGDCDQGLSFCVCLARFWDTHGHLQEGRAQLERALSHATPDTPRGTKATALVQAGWAATEQRDAEAAIRYLDEALLFALEGNDLLGQRRVLCCLGSAYLVKRELCKAKELFLRSLEIHRQTGNRRGAAGVLNNLAETALIERDIGLAEQYLQAVRHEMAPLWSGAENEGGTFFSNCAFLELLKSDLPAAFGYATSAVRRLLARGDLVSLPCAIACLAIIALQTNEPQRAAWLLGAVDRLLAVQGASLPEYMFSVHSETLTRAVAALPEVQFKAQFEEWGCLSASDIVRMLYAHLGESSPPNAAKGSYCL